MRDIDAGAFKTHPLTRMVLTTHDEESRMRLKTWIKRLGFWGFLFFLVKGLLWLAIPALIALWATE